jgi:diketogulonate reductase-like aldo/keto reductase
MVPSEKHVDADVSIGTEDTFPDRLQAVPRLLYGTAFKGSQTTSIVGHALKAGFKGIDTAAMTRAYQERLAGESIRHAVQKGVLNREDIWVCVHTNVHNGRIAYIYRYNPNSRPTFQRRMQHFSLTM